MITYVEDDLNKRGDKEKEMLDNDKWIGAQAIMKEVIAKCPEYEGRTEPQVLQEDWIRKRFEFALMLMEDYAKISAPINQTTTSTPNNYPTPKTYESHLSDERVAEGIAKESDKFHYASEAQCKRAYAIQMSNKWEKWQVKSLAQRFGFSDTRKIPSKVYDAFVRELQAGPKMENGSSHLQ